MFVVRLWGGIGNQLFQYAFGEYVRDKFNVDIYYDICSFGNSDKLRNLELKSLTKEGLPIARVSKFFHSRYKGIVGKILKCFYMINPKHVFVTEDKWEKLKHESFSFNKDYYFQGYWQDANFASFLLKNDILSIDLKTLPVELSCVYNEICFTENSVSLHVRRGDYFDKKNVGIYGVCTKSYFERALNSIDKNISKKVFVFSDDIKWVMENILLPKNTILVPNYDVPQFWYIYLMSLCKYNILSNSTFSWWGAYLNKNHDKKVIGPSKWLLNSSQSLMLDSWIKINV